MEPRAEPFMAWCCYFRFFELMQRLKSAAGGAVGAGAVRLYVCRDYRDFAPTGAGHGLHRITAEPSYFLL